MPEAPHTHCIATLQCSLARRMSAGSLQAKMGTAGEMSHSDLHHLRAEITDLRKFAVLNYVAVIKAVKKRNRHLGAKVGGAFVQMRAMDVLSRQYFYTSPKLARLATRAEIISQVRPEGRAQTRVCAPSTDNRMHIEWPQPRCCMVAVCLLWLGMATGIHLPRSQNGVCSFSCTAVHQGGSSPGCCMQGLESPAAKADELQAEYGCPICLGLLHNPVVLTCAHRFCWGCLLAHCATNLQSHGASLHPGTGTWQQQVGCNCAHAQHCGGLDWFTTGVNLVQLLVVLMYMLRCMASTMTCRDVTAFAQGIRGSTIHPAETTTWRATIQNRRDGAQLLQLQSPSKTLPLPLWPPTTALYAERPTS